MRVWELWDVGRGNLLGEYASRQEALAAIGWVAGEFRVIAGEEASPSYEAMYEALADELDHWHGWCSCHLPATLVEHPPR